MIRGDNLARVRGRLPYLRVGSSRWKAATDALAWIHDCGNQAGWGLNFAGVWCIAKTALPIPSNQVCAVAL
jgi:hypothetical protein